MFCSECGSKLKDGARFCENCGARVPEAANEPAEEKTASMFGGSASSGQPISMFGGAAADPLTGSMFGGFGEPIPPSAEKPAEPKKAPAPEMTAAPAAETVIAAEKPQVPASKPEAGPEAAPTFSRPEEPSGYRSEFSQTPPRAPEPPSMGSSPSWTAYRRPEGEQGQWQNAEQPQYSSATFPQAIKLYFKHFLDFDGRATRGEYWWAVMFNTLMLMGLQMIPFVGGVLNGVYNLSYLVGGISLTIRRLHDMGKPSVSILFGLIPLAGPIILMVWCCRPSQGANVFGASPWDDPNHFSV